MNVSVVVPAYNAARFVRRAIDSALRQSLPPQEVVVVDDGSQDDTADVVRAYGPPVRCVSQANAGASIARNVGIEQSKGDWIALLDADEEWLPHKLERQAEVLRAHPDLAWCGCNKEDAGGGAAPAVRAPRAVAQTLRRLGSLPFFEVGRRRLGLQTSGFVIRRSVFDDIGGFDSALRVCHDKDLFWRIAVRHPRFGYVPEILYRYFVDSPVALTRVGVAARCRREPVHEPAACARGRRGPPGRLRAVCARARNRLPVPPGGRRDRDRRRGDRDVAVALPALGRATSAAGVAAGAARPRRAPRRAGGAAPLSGLTGARRPDQRLRGSSGESKL